MFLKLMNWQLIRKLLNEMAVRGEIEIEREREREREREVSCELSQGQQCRREERTCHGKGSIQVGVTRRQGRVRVVTALVIVVLDVEAAQLRVLNAQGAARVVDVLTVQGLPAKKGKENNQSTTCNSLRTNNNQQH